MDRALHLKGKSRARKMPGTATLRARAAILLLFLLAILGTSCRGATEGTSRPVLTLMLPPSERPFWIPIARGFENLRPGIEVDLIEGPQSTDLRENLYTAALLARDSTFDLVYMDVTWTPKFAAAGWLEPLDAWVPPAEQARFLPVALAAGRFQGRLYRLPVRTDVGVLYHRKDWLEAAKEPPPETFDDLMRIARALQSPPGRWGFLWQGKQYEGLVCVFLEVLHGEGGFWVDPKTLDVGLDQAPAVRALKFLQATVGPDPISPPGVTTYQEEESRRIFQDGRAVFLRSWPYVWRLAEADDSPLRGRVGVGRPVRAAGGERAGVLGGWGLGVSAYSRHRALAVEFARFATTLESQRRLCGPTGFAPARAEAYEDAELLAVNPFLARLRALQDGAVLRPAIRSYALASDILQRHLSAALAGGDDAEGALASAASETRLLLRQERSEPAEPEGGA